MKLNDLWSGFLSAKLPVEWLEQVLLLPDGHATDATRRDWPEVAAMDKCPQQPEHHPEGDVLVHTRMVVAQADRLAKENGLSVEDRALLLMSALCHDVGKPKVTKYDEGRKKWTAHGHGEEGVPVAEAFMRRIGASEQDVKRVAMLVKYHLLGAVASVSKKRVRGIMRDLDSAEVPHEVWRLLVQADVNGRAITEEQKRKELPDLAGMMAEIGAEDREQARRDGLFARCLPSTDDILAANPGLAKGPELGRVINAAKEAILSGKAASREDALKIAKSAFSDAWRSR